jgi:hypothetical protein
MIRKRAPGGGRKPAGPFKGKSAQLTTRLTSQTRSALERESRQTGQSISQIAERYIEQGLGRKRDSGSPQTQALTQAIKLLIDRVETNTGKRWHEDGFTAEVIYRGLPELFTHYRSNAEPIIPPQVAAAARRTPSIAATLRDPAGLAQLEVGTLVYLIENSQSPGTEQLRDDQLARWKILRDLGSRWYRESK